MTLSSILQALLLGIVEGLTEFLPVSSTAHLLLGGALLGFDSPNRTFEVMVQLGAICALLFVPSYFVPYTAMATRPIVPTAMRQ